MHDLLVLGGGPGGYIAALRAAQLGLDVCLVEKEHLGGVCLNKGCIPSKTLLAATELFGKIKKAEEWGIEVGSPVWNTKKLIEKKEEVVRRMRQGIDILCQKRKIHLVRGRGVLTSPGAVQVGSDTLKAKNLILATGSLARTNDFGIKRKDALWTSEEALMLPKIPKSLLVLGGGPEGCELALVYAALGSQVTVVEAKERLLPGFDRDASSAMKRALKAKGIEVYTGETVSGIVERDSLLEAKLQGGTLITTEILLVSIGRVPNSQAIGLEAAGIGVSEKKAVITDAFLRTTVPSVYAIGDLTGRLMMAHVASHEGYVVASRLAGQKLALDSRSVPSCVYTYPEVAEVGLNEEIAREQNIPYEIGRFSFAALGRSQAKGQTEGFVKIIGHAKTGQILGGVVVGDEAPEIINLIGLALRKELKVEDLRSHMAPHPSATEAVSEAAHLFYKEGLHFA